MFNVVAKIGGGYEVRSGTRTIRVFVGPTAHEDAWQLRDQLAHAEIDRRELRSDPTQPDPEEMTPEELELTARYAARIKEPHATGPAPFLRAASSASSRLGRAADGA